MIIMKIKVCSVHLANERMEKILYICMCMSILCECIRRVYIICCHIKYNYYHPLAAAATV